MENSIKNFIDSLVKELRLGGYKKATKILDNPIYLQRIADDGDYYQVHVDAMYDDKQKGNIRVSFSVYNNRHKKLWQRLIKPIDTPNYNEDYIIAPDGSFVDEQNL